MLTWLVNICSVLVLSLISGVGTFLMSYILDTTPLPLWKAELYALPACGIFMMLALLLQHWAKKQDRGF